MKTYEYRVVKSSDSMVVVEELNALAKEGFRVVSTAGCGYMGNWCWWTLEREVQPADPYR